MQNDVISTSAFARVVRAGDSKRFDVNLRENRATVLSDAVLAILEARAGRLGRYATTKLRSKDCVSYLEYADHLALRSISRHLKSKLKVSLPNRDAIIRGVIESLLDSTPITIIRRDISSFYETISTDPLREMVVYDTGSPLVVRELLSLYFDNHCSSGRGLPRGVGLSAIFAEIAMKTFDQEVRKIDGVYRYYRFSDDIIVFSFSDAAAVSQALEQALPDGMSFNRRKHSDTSMPAISKSGPNMNHSFEYLGYKFSVEAPKSPNTSRVVNVSISESKLKRMKSRVILTLKAFQRRNNFYLLRDRLRFISGNYEVRRSGHSLSKGKTHVRSGLFYNYRQCGRYYFSGTLRVEQHPAKELKEIDGFFRALLRSPKSKFASSLASVLTSEQRSELERISFAAGYLNKMTIRLTPVRVSEVKGAWHHA